MTRSSIVMSLIPPQWDLNPGPCDTKLEASWMLQAEKYLKTTF